MKREKISLTIGNFDGVHLGHKRLIDHLKQSGDKTAVVTFTNHPSTVLKDKPTQTITTIQHKLLLLNTIDTVLLQTFTKELSLLSALEFLKAIQKQCPFNHLVLGANAKIGHKREGTPEKIREIAEILNFTVDYLPLLEEGHTVISSSAIRQAIAEGNLEQASIMLGRPYSILAPVVSGMAKGRVLGFKTLNFALDQLLLPPLGVYIVSAIYKNTRFQAVANLGFAPTLKQSVSPLLEVHLLDFDEEIPHQECVEIIFHTYLREERKFSTLWALKEQISQDIHQTKAFFS